MFSNLSYFISFHLLPHGLAGHSCTAPFFPLLLFYFIPFATTWSCPLAPFVVGRLRHCLGGLLLLLHGQKFRQNKQFFIWSCCLRFYSFLPIQTIPSLLQSFSCSLSRSLTHSLSLSLSFFSLSVFFSFSPACRTDEREFAQDFSKYGPNTGGKHFIGAIGLGNGSYFFSFSFPVLSLPPYTHTYTHTHIVRRESFFYSTHTPLQFPSQNNVVRLVLPLPLKPCSTIPHYISSSKCCF